METINEKDESLRRLFFEFLDFFFLDEVCE